MHAGSTLLAALIAAGTAPVALAQAPVSAPPPPAQSAPQDETFSIKSYVVTGNTILAQDEVLRLVAPFTGDKRVYGDIQKALEALEGAYRSRGFSAVQVFVPEQTLDTGSVKLGVIEAKIAAIKIEGHAFFDEANIRAALPSQPTVKELVDAVFATRRELGPITDEVVRRENAALAMAAFLSADPAELGLEAAMFRLGAEVWLTPSRTPRS